MLSILTFPFWYVMLPIGPSVVRPDGNWSPMLCNHRSVLVLFGSRYSTPLLWMNLAGLPSFP